MKKLFKNGADKIKTVFGSLGFGMALAFRAAPFFTCARIAAIIAGQLLPLLRAFALAALIDSVVSLSGKTIAIWSAVLIAACLSQALLSSLNNTIDRLSQNKVNHAVDRLLISRIAASDMSFYDDTKKNDALNAIKNEQYVFEGIVFNSVYGVSSAITLITELVVLATLSPWLALIAFVCVLPSALDQKRYMDKLWNYDWEQSNTYRRAKYYQNLITGNDSFHSELRLYNNFGYFLNKYLDLWHSWYGEKTKMVRRHSLVQLALFSLRMVSDCAAFALALWRYTQGLITVGRVQYYVSVADQFSGQMLEVLYCVSDLAVNSDKIDAFRLFVNEKPRVIPQGDAVPEDKPEIEFRDVTFTYPSCEEPVLKNVSFTIHSGEKVAFVGLNGAGKSTVVKLMLRFYDIDSGQILIGGQDIKSYNLRALRDMYGAVFQDYVTYSLTAGENVRLGDISRPNGDISQALELAGATELVNEMKDGERTPLTRLFDEKGAELSGGQRQKLALARAFYRDANTLILDEPAASLDPEAEHEIFAHLAEHWRDKTAVLISHRLANVTHCDKIIVISGASVAEQGSHAELMRANGVYAELFRVQAEKYVRN